MKYLIDSAPEISYFLLVFLKPELLELVDLVLIHFCAECRDCTEHAADPGDTTERGKNKPWVLLSTSLNCLFDEILLSRIYYFRSSMLHCF